MYVFQALLLHLGEVVSLRLLPFRFGTHLCLCFEDALAVCVYEVKNGRREESGGEKGDEEEAGGGLRRGGISARAHKAPPLLHLSTAFLFQM